MLVLTLQWLLALPKNSSVVFVFDSLDSLDDQTLAWLPFSFPEGVKVILSATDGSKAHTILKDAADRKWSGKIKVCSN